MITFFIIFGFGFTVFLLLMEVNWCKIGIHNFKAESKEYRKNDLFKKARKQLGIYREGYYIIGSVCSYCGKTNSEHSDY